MLVLQYDGGATAPVPYAVWGAEELPTTRPESSRTLTLVLKAQNPNDFNSGAYLHPWGGERYASLDEGERLPGSAATQEAERLLTSVQQSLSFGIAPQLSWDGTGGTYVLRDARRIPIAAFKPRDEEPFAPNNPRGLPGKMGQVFSQNSPTFARCRDPVFATCQR